MDSSPNIGLTNRALGFYAAKIPEAWTLAEYSKVREELDGIAQKEVCGFESLSAYTLTECRLQGQRITDASQALADAIDGQKDAERKVATCRALLKNEKSKETLFNKYAKVCVDSASSIKSD